MTKPKKSAERRVRLLDSNGKAYLKRRRAAQRLAMVNDVEALMRDYVIPYLNAKFAIPPPRPITKRGKN